jgi:hypothetical protein
VADLSAHELIEYLVERANGDGGPHARELWMRVWLIDVGQGGQALQAAPPVSSVRTSMSWLAETTSAWCRWLE